MVFAGRKAFVHLVIDDQPLWPKRVPSGEQRDREHGEGEFPFVHVHLSFEIRLAASPPKKPSTTPNESRIRIASTAGWKHENNQTKSRTLNAGDSLTYASFSEG
jgi:hypothetical protein